MADKLQIEIGLDGAEEVNQRLRQIEQTAANVTRTVVNFTEAFARLGATAALVAGTALVKFAAGGTSAKDFASSMTKLSSSIDDVAQKIKAQNALEMLGEKQGKALIAWANDVDALSQHYEHLGEAVLGVGNRISNGLTTLDTQTKAVLNSLAKVSDSNERWLQLADILKSMSATDAAKIGEKLGFS